MVATQQEVEEYRRKALVVDIEADGLLEELTKVHVTSVAYFSEEKEKYDVYSVKEANLIHTLTDVSPDQPIVGHNFYLFDIPAVEKLYGKKIPLKNIETLYSCLGI